MAWSLCPPLKHAKTLFTGMSAIFDGCTIRQLRSASERT
jgi:hypothetical protein